MRLFLVTAPKQKISKMFQQSSSSPVLVRSTTGVCGFGGGWGWTRRVSSRNFKTAQGRRTCT